MKTRERNEVVIAALLLLVCSAARGAGMLVPTDKRLEPLSIKSH